MRIFNGSSTLIIPLLLNEWQFDDVLDVRKCHIINRNSKLINLSKKYLICCQKPLSSESYEGFKQSWWISSLICLQDKIQATEFKLQIRDRSSFLRVGLPVHHCPQLFFILLMLTAYSNRPGYFMPGYLPMCFTSAGNALLGMLPTGKILSTQCWFLSALWHHICHTYMLLSMYFHTELQWFVTCPPPLL